MDDLISRAAVVDEIEGVDWYHINKNGEMVHGANSAEHQAWYKANDIYAAIERVPSAQPVAKDICVPVEDCISRQAALKTAEWAYRACEGNLSYYHDLLVAALMDLTPAQSGWIPCSERLPEDGRIVLWCNEHGSVFTTAITVHIGNSWAVGKRHRSSEIIAWMPLPEPWKGERDG